MACNAPSTSRLPAFETSEACTHRTEGALNDRLTKGKRAFS